MNRAGWLCVGVLLGLVPAGAVLAVDEPPAMVISGAPYEVSESDDGKVLSLEVTNLTGLDFGLSVRAGAGGACTPTTNPTVEAARSAAVVFTFPAACVVDEEGTDIELRAMAGGTEIAVQTITLTPSEASDDPDYGVLARYWQAALAAVALALIAWIFGDRAYRSSRGQLPVVEGNETPTHLGPLRPLPSIASDWSFADSWGTNVGVAAALFTGLFGATELLESILGDDGESLVAVAVVAAALTAALIGVGPVMLSIFSLEGKNTVLGVLLSSVAVLAANLGFIWVMYSVLSTSEIVGQDVLSGSAIAAALVIAVYTLRSIPRTLAEGAAIPPPPTDSETILAARMISESILANVWLTATEEQRPEVQERQRQIDSLHEDYPLLGTSPGDDVGRPVSAML